MSFSNSNAGGAVPQVQSDPIYSLPHLYISGLNISVYSTTVLAIAPGACRDQSNNIDIEVGFSDLQGNITPSIQFQNYQPPILINSAVTGANGLDLGSLAASTQYAVWIIADSSGYKPVAGILSLVSNIAPLLPLGYDSMRLLGFIVTDGSSHFVFASHASGAPQMMVDALSYYITPTSVTASNATSFTAIDLSAAIPTTTLPNVIVWLKVTFTPASAGDTVQFRPTGSSATANLVTIFGQVAGVAQTQYIEVVAGVGSSKPEIDYKVTSSSDSVSILVVSWTAADFQTLP